MVCSEHEPSSPKVDMSFPDGKQARSSFSLSRRISRLSFGQGTRRIRYRVLFFCTLLQEYGTQAKIRCIHRHHRFKFMVKYGQRPSLLYHSLHLFEGHLLLLFPAEFRSVLQEPLHRLHGFREPRNTLKVNSRRIVTPNLFRIRWRSPSTP